MRVRILQFEDEGQWYDDAYAVQESSGQVVFHYNLTWERVGSHCNAKLQETGVSLEEIETVIPAGEGWRWLPVEVVEDEKAEALLEELNERCCIPKPRPIKIVHPMAAWRVADPAPSPPPGSGPDP